MQPSRYFDWASLKRMIQDGFEQESAVGLSGREFALPTDHTRPSIRILLYTGSSDCERTLGGLVHVGRRIPEVVGVL